MNEKLVLSNMECRIIKHARYCWTVFFIHIYGQKKRRFSLVTFVIEDIKPVQSMCLSSQFLNSNIYKHLPLAISKCN